MHRLLLAAAVFLFGTATPAAAAIIVYETSLSGAAEEPSTPSTGTGTATLTFDTDLNTMTLEVEFSGLTGTVTAAHIHCCTADPAAGNVGVATAVPTFPGFPAGVTAGSYAMTFDLTLPSSFNPAFITANGGTPADAEAALLAGVAEGRAYLNIHTAAFPTGEIRGFLVPARAIPEPAAIGLFALGIGALALARRGRKRRGEAPHA